MAEINGFSTHDPVITNSSVDDSAVSSLSTNVPLISSSLANDPAISSSSTSQGQISYSIQHDASAESTNQVVTNSQTEDSTTTTTIVETTTVQADIYFFVLPTCSDPSRIGIACNISGAPCDLIQPCQNNGICNNVNTTLRGYVCSCLAGFNGTECQFDHRSCKPTTCWNNSTCKELSNSTFVCRCEEGWQGVHCETKINYCENITCQNRGVCRPLFRDYKCECLGGGYSGRHCEIVMNKIIVRQVVSKSVSYIAILCLLTVAGFIVFMDVLKYCFGIDPVHEEREKLRRKKQVKKQKTVIHRFRYVHPPSSFVSIKQTDP